MEESTHFAYNVALEPQAAKSQTFMSANNVMQNCGAVSGFLLVFSDIINLFQILLHTYFSKECQILTWVCLGFYRLALLMDIAVHYNDTL